MLILPEERILSLFSSGIYLTNRDIVSIGKKIGIELPLKTRDYVFKKVINHAKEEKKVDEFVEEIDQLLDKRKAEYATFAQSYQNADDLIAPWQEKIEQLQEDFKGLLND